MNISGQVKELIDKIIDKNPSHKKYLQGSLSLITEEEIKQLDTYISFCISSGTEIDYLVEAYLTVVIDSMKEQIYFQKHNKYRYSKFSEVASDIYYNNEYMTKYMYGVALSTYFWPNHLKIYRFFQDVIPKNKTGKYIEIGPGHGSFMLSAMKLSSYDTFQGVDISQTSVKLTQDILKYFQQNDNKSYSIDLMDFLKADLALDSYDAIVTGEVLEHVEQPNKFLKRIADIAKKDAFIYVTTCINAPAIDHIYLFRTPEDISELFTSCGLSIDKEILLPYVDMSLKKCAEEHLPVNVAYVLKKN